MIHILYRHTQHTSGKGKSRPEWFSYENSLNNILKTIEGRSDVTFHLLYDGKVAATDPRIHHTIEFEGGSDKASFFYAWEYAKDLELGDKDLVYFCENDYLHVEGWVDKILDMFTTYNIPGYVSLYDHSDKYTESYSDLVSRVYVTSTCHWRTVPSTCGSFIVNKTTLDEDYDVHTTFYSDHDKFIKLGEDRGRVIVSPMPSLSTHCEVEWLAPIVNWKELSFKYE